VVGGCGDDYGWGGGAVCREGEVVGGQGEGT
jgi:hypothetical protein